MEKGKPDRKRNLGRVGNKMGRRGKELNRERGEKVESEDYNESSPHPLYTE